MSDRNKDKGADLSPYLNEEVIDKKWMEEVVKKGKLVVERPA